MAEIRSAFQEKSDYPALARFAGRLRQTPHAPRPLQVACGRQLPGAPADGTFPVRRRRLLLWEGDEVRAFHNFFEHEITVAGKPYRFVWLNGPLSEGIVNPRYAPCWPLLVQHSLRLHPFHLLMGGPPQVHAIL